MSDIVGFYKRAVQGSLLHTDEIDLVGHRGRMQIAVNAEMRSLEEKETIPDTHGSYDCVILSVSINELDEARQVERTR